ncbi:hypothetical protein LF1_22760 [Rubripirellula obstinata]|uniref:Uncharacterized protein n=1 Tax=Rubripirellula obstinata TaxID=406547 RepID=A0A5B1CJ34_9BACT|nr:hypothetical protein LF1_22760 [Rubripirellula obstinata]
MSLWLHSAYEDYEHGKPTGANEKRPSGLGLGVVSFWFVDRELCTLGRGHREQFVRSHHDAFVDREQRAVFLVGQVVHDVQHRFF